jgi:ribosomal RNA-processing protein 12
LILQLFYLRQPLLSQHGIEVLTAYITSQSSNLPAHTLIDLLRAVLEIEDFRDIKVMESHPGIINLLRRGIDKLTRIEPTAAASISAGVVSLMIPLLNSHQVGVRRTTVQGLKDVIAVALLNDNAKHQVLPLTHKRASPSRSVIAAIESTLGPQYQDAWELALQLSEEVFCHVGRQRAGLAAGILHRVARLCERGEDIAMLENLSLEEIKEEKRLASAACSAYGSAIRSLGPQAVLEMLPMQLEEGLNGQVEARPWVLPLLRIYTRESQLSYWTDHLFPIAKNMAARAASSSNHHESTICATLDKQIWDTLPSFATWSNDVGSAFG